jgi:hypothetical protein
MTVLATRQPKSKIKARARVFQICFLIDTNAYVVSKLPAEPAAALAAYRFRKVTGDQAVYDVRVTEHGPECDCQGHLRHGHCKHVETLQQAKAVFDDMATETLQASRWPLSSSAAQ